MRNPTPKDEVPLLEASGNRVHAISTEPLDQSHGFSDVQKHLGGGPRQLAGSIRRVDSPPEIGLHTEALACLHTGPK